MGVNAPLVVPGRFIDEVNEILSVPRNFPLTGKLAIRVNGQKLGAAGAIDIWPPSPSFVPAKQPFSFACV
jgi:hypothetical protein